MNDSVIRSIDPCETSINELLRLEEASWPQRLRASESTIRERFRLGHEVVGAVVNGSLVAAAGFVHTSQAPTDRLTFPTDHRTYSSLPASTPVCSTFVYNLCVVPGQRGRGAVRQILRAVESEARARRARFLVGDARCPAYAGGRIQSRRRVERDAVFREALDNWHASGVHPTDHVLMRDPVLRLYYRYLQCEFLFPVSGFLPEDTASGGFSVICVKRLNGQVR